MKPKKPEENKMPTLTEKQKAGKLGATKRWETDLADHRTLEQLRQGRMADTWKLDAVRPVLET